MSRDTPQKLENQQQALLRLVAFFETLSTVNLELIPLVYAQDAWFKDPFNEVTGLPAIKQLFAHMFVQVDGPRFVVTHHMRQDDSAFLTWDFYFRMKRFSAAEQCIRGATHCRFDSEGYVIYHRDYWDAAEELYEKLPVLGGFMRILKRAARK
ncbi:nuclear transport factor 2 family protein [Glaciimonas sp. PCH181]|uniref:nuclear transport factor 2 family protein n=1 Tax=Glaciimonas sp. PCH181 TaxID=2133943 RepID=UPI000D362D4F|nr:nuclear transport factor 2 family protein [Glaciimonas sp. PCH181]PUA18218.1 isomerase [Glaciimonas sp. PCH181]